MIINQSNFKSNDEEEESPPPNATSQQKEIIGDLYLDTQVIALYDYSNYHYHSIDLVEIKHY